MSKKTNHTSYNVFFKDGTSAVACCGPAILALGNSVGGYEKRSKPIPCQDTADPCPVKRIRAERQSKREKALYDLRIKIEVAETRIEEESDKLYRMKTELNNLVGRHIGQATNS